MTKNISKWPNSNECIFFYFMVIWLSVPSLVLGNELWLEPTSRSANKIVGNWATANIGGETHFAFHIPDNYDKANENSHAFIILVPEEDAIFEYIVRLNVVRNGQPHNTMPANTGLLNLTVTGGQLIELDISSLLPTFLPSDYVTINLELPNKKDSTQVVGMRFQYVGIDVSVAGTNCPAGQVVTGYDTSGTVTCKVDLDTRAAGECSPGQVVRAINSDGTVACVPDLFVNNLSCPPGQFLTGFTANGELQCVLLAGVNHPCEHGGTEVGERWIISFSGQTVCDKQTNYTWEQHPTSRTQGWEESVSYCQSLSLGGEWILPGIEELETLVDNNSSTCHPGSPDSLCLPDNHPFDNVRSGFYWSSTEHPGFFPRSYAYGIRVSEGVLAGNFLYNHKATSNFSWCMRR